MVYNPDAACGGVGGVGATPAAVLVETLLHTAMLALSKTPAQTLLVGDSRRDLEAARAAGCDSALVLTGNGRQTAATLGGDSPPTYVDLTELSDALLG